MNPEEVRRHWAVRDGEYSPTYYGHLGPNATSEALRSVLSERVGRDAAILELGCSAGRHLAALLDEGYTDLHGIEINEAAREVMAETSPTLAATGTFYFDAIEAVVPGFEDDRFDVVFSVETLQHLHPDSAWVFEDLARIAADLLVTVENEGGEGAQAPEAGVNYVRDAFPLYYRDWGRIFTDLGLEAVEVVDLGRDTLRVFRVPSA